MQVDGPDPFDGLASRAEESAPGHHLRLTRSASQRVRESWSVCEAGPRQLDIDRTVQPSEQVI